MPSPSEAAPALFLDDELPPMPGKIEQQAYDIYNDVAGRVGWTKAQKLTPDRCKKLLRAVKDVGGLQEWRKALERGGRSTFLTTKFRPDLEFVTRLPKLTKMAEGGFDDQGTDTSTGKRSIVSQAAPQDHWALALRDYKPRGWWPPSLGPRPEDPACRAPAAMLQACRERLGITVGPVVQESREDRLRASIASYRRVGNHARANEIESQLAAIEGRPAVLVPAADARNPDVVPGDKPVSSGEKRRGPIFEASPADVDQAQRAVAIVEPPPPNPDDYPPGGDESDGEQAPY